MKNEKQQQAKHLYFQTDLNKTQIAEMLDVNRRTVMLWVQQGNWDRLKLSAMHLPSMIVEKCYYMLNHYLDNLLSASSTISTFGPKEAAAINSLASSIKKLRTRSAVNESMEMMSFFLEDVRRQDPNMADAIMPFIEQYIAKRKDVNISDFLPANFNEEGFVNESEDDIRERWLDEEEQEKINGELAEPAFAASKAKKAEQASANANNQNKSEAPVPATADYQEAVTVSSSNYPPRRGSDAYVPSSPLGSSNTIPTITNYQNRQQARKLTHQVEKQLTDYLKNQNNNPVAA